MKKLFLLSTFILSVLSISGCYDEENQKTENNQAQKVVQPQEEILPSRTK
jgi:hypothetical protein